MTAQQKGSLKVQNESFLFQERRKPTKSDLVDEAGRNNLAEGEHKAKERTTGFARGNLSWKAPSRPFKKRDKDYYLTVGAIIFLLITILFFIKEWMAIAAILAVAFVSYVLSTVPPEEVTYEITDKGLRSFDRFYRWEEMGEFWFEEKWGQKMLIVTFRPPFLGRVHLMLGEMEEEKVKNILSQNLPFRERPEKSWSEQTADWLAKKFPLEKT